MISAKIEKLRKEQNLSLDELSKRTGYSAPGLLKAIQKNEFKITMLEKIAQALNVNFCSFFQTEEDLFKKDLYKIVFAGGYKYMFTQLEPRDEDFFDLLNYSNVEQIRIEELKSFITKGFAGIYLGFVYDYVLSSAVLPIAENISFYIELDKIDCLMNGSDYGGGYSILTDNNWSHPIHLKSFIGDALRYIPQILDITDEVIEHFSNKTITDENFEDSETWEISTKLTRKLENAIEEREQLFAEYVAKSPVLLWLVESKILSTRDIKMMIWQITKDYAPVMK